MYDLSRFIKAHELYYDQALKEIRQGQKVTHWMWFIFPQIKGLGYSETAIYYSISSLEEASDYYHHELLGGHLLEISQALLDLKKSDPVFIFGSIDAMKLRSSMTLFSLLEEDKVFDDVLVRFYGGKRDDKTLEILGLK